MLLYILPPSLSPTLSLTLSNGCMSNTQACRHISIIMKVAISDIEPNPAVKSDMLRYNLQEKRG